MDNELNGNDYDFSTPVTQDITLKAVFEEIQTNATVTFNLNYSGAPNDGILSTDTVSIGSKVTKPTDPTRTGLIFTGWYTEAACTNAFNFNNEISESITLYALWQQRYVFEAEYTDIAEKGGKGYSCEAFGVSMIDVPELHRQDGNEANPPTPSNASNNAWVSYLYYEESTLEFVIYADKECDAIASMWISCEFFDMTFNPSIYQFRVNGVSQAYASVTLNGHDHGFNATRAEFVEVKMTNKIHLNEGENKITLVATNDISHGGTMTADAPMVDCIVLIADEDILSWDPITENMTEYYKQLNN